MIGDGPIDAGRRGRSPNDSHSTWFPMPESLPIDEVELLLENARLRDALEPYLDESLEVLRLNRRSTREENEFLASMLAWERAPIVPISQWFEPELRLPRPESLDDASLHRILGDTLKRLYEKRVQIEFTDHLSDRRLYAIIYRDILPSLEKRLESPRNYLHWRCMDPDDDAELWLRYYATDDERREWSIESGQAPPARERPPFPRRMPFRGYP